MSELRNDIRSPYRCFAFISYSHRDMKVAKWLQRKLEGFRLPTQIHNDIDSKSRYLRPVFRDQSDLNAGILGDELRKHLEESKFLIIICSIHSAKSRWVSDEAKAFLEMGRLDRIIPVIIPDKDCSEQELFPIYLREYFRFYPDRELLGINLGETGKEKTIIRIVSKMLDVSFDSLWKRHLRQKRVRIISSSVAGVLVLTAAYFFAIPVTLDINVDAEPANLPTGDKAYLNIDGGEYGLKTGAPQFVQIKTPGYKRLSHLHLHLASQFYNPIDTAVVPGFGLRRVITLGMSRDSTFAVFGGTVYDESMKPLAGTVVTVSHREATTDANGSFRLTIPLSEQREVLPITLTKEGYQTVERSDETPGDMLKYIMYRK